jgi:hypothetical protein
MARSKPFSDPRGPHVRIYFDLLDSVAWNALSASDQRAYTTLRRALGKTNNGDLSLPLSRARHYGIRSPATLAKSLRALVAVGLIAVTRRGGCTRGGQRLPTLYRFTDEQVYPFPGKMIDGSGATNDWKQVESIDHARALIAKAEAKARAVAAEKRPLQFPNATGSSGEAIERKTNSQIESWRSGPVRKLKSAGGV